MSQSYFAAPSQLDESTSPAHFRIYGETSDVDDGEELEGQDLAGGGVGGDDYLYGVNGYNEPVSQ